MDLGAKNRERLPLIFHENFPKPKDESPLFFHLQDFHPLEKFNLNVSSSSFSSSSHPFFPMYLDPFENPTFGSLPNFELYETKPFETQHGPLLIPFMDNFNPNGGGLGLFEVSQVVAPINMLSPNSHQAHNLSNYRELGFMDYPAPQDEGSSTSTNNDGVMVTYSPPPVVAVVRKEARTRKKTTNVIMKGQWTVEEDRRLVQLVERFGVRKWSHIAQLLNGRVGKQCRERWLNHLKPNIKKDLWSEEEDRILIKAHQEIGNKWAEIAKRLPGRTENSIKNHWNATKRKVLSKKKSRAKYPRQTSLLQEYVKSLNPETINAGGRKMPSSSTTHVEKNPNLPDINQTVGSSYSSSGERLGQHDQYAFSSEVPDFNFDAQMLEESNIDSLLDGARNKIEVGPMVHYGVKKELDLVEMINHGNL